MSAPPHRFPSYDAFLFDMDGTLLSSIAVVERVWSAFARHHGLDVASFMPRIHGIRAGDLIASLRLPGVDVAAEVERVTAAELADVDGVIAIAGAGAFLRALPPDRWAIVTSAPRALATLRLEASDLPIPAVFVTAEDVSRGKPAPDGFLLAAARLGVDPARCLVFEDAVAGIAAAEAAGMSAAVVTATHRHGWRAELPSIEGYDGLGFERDADGGMVLRGLASALPRP